MTDPAWFDSIEVGYDDDDVDLDESQRLTVRGRANSDPRRLYNIDGDLLAPDEIDDTALAAPGSTWFRAYGNGYDEPPAEWELQFPDPGPIDSDPPTETPDAFEAKLCTTCGTKPRVSHGECDTCRVYRKRHKGQQRPARLAERQGALNLRRPLRPGETGVTRAELDAIAKQRRG